MAASLLNGPYDLTLSTCTICVLLPRASLVIHSTTEYYIAATISNVAQHLFCFPFLADKQILQRIEISNTKL